MQLYPHNMQPGPAVPQQHRAALLPLPDLSWQAAGSLLLHSFCTQVEATNMLLVVLLLPTHSCDQRQHAVSVWLPPHWEWHAPLSASLGLAAPPAQDRLQSPLWMLTGGVCGVLPWTLSLAHLHLLMR